MVDTVTIGTRHINICDDVNELANIVALQFCRLSKISIEQKGMFVVALSGGSTPVILYKRLISNEISSLIDWSKIHFFVSDERCVPESSPDNNFHTAKVNLFDYIRIPENNLHPTKFQDKDPQLAAANYEKSIREFFAANNLAFTSDDIPKFDLIFLGMGPDGHCASLFPNTEALQEKELLVKENYVERLKAHRITFTYPLINNAANVIFLVSGNDKSQILAEVLENDKCVYPAHNVILRDGSLEWFLDEAAASGLCSIFNNSSKIK